MTEKQFLFKLLKSLLNNPDNNEICKDIVNRLESLFYPSPIITVRTLTEYEEYLKKEESEYDRFRRVTSAIDNKAKKSWELSDYKIEQMCKKEESNQ